MKKLKLFFIIFLALLSFEVSANNGDAFQNRPIPNSGTAPSSAPIVYSFQTMGIRFSLYKYDGKNLVSIARRDLSLGKNADFEAVASSEMLGKLDYTVLGKSVVFNKRIAYPFTDRDAILDPIYVNLPNQGLTANDLRNKIIRRLKLREGADNIAREVNNFFSLNNKVNSDEIFDLYITVEPTAMITMRTCNIASKTYSAPACVGGSRRYGTIYELINVSFSYLTDPKHTFGQVVKTYIPNLIYAKLNQNYNDIHNFVAPIVGKESVNYLIDNVPAAIRNFGGGDINTNPKSGYGIGVFWLAAEMKTCSSTCHGKKGDELLRCAENYCSVNYTKEKTSKKTCIDNCGYVPESLKCPETTRDFGKNTVCKASTSSERNSCSIETANIGGSNYRYMLDCIVSTKVDFPDLGGAVNPGSAYSYQVLVSGNKMCRISFDYLRWKYDYAIAETEAQRQGLLDVVTKFSSQNWSSQTYDSKNLDLKIQVDEALNKGSRKITKNLVPNPNYNYGSASASVSKTASQKVFSYNAGKPIEITVDSIATRSQNAVYFNLPAQCLSDNKPGVVLDAKNNNCLAPLKGPYYKVYTSFDAKPNAINPSITFATDKNDSGLDVENTCQYITKDVSCTLANLSKADANGLYKRGEKLEFSFLIHGDRSLVKEIRVSGATKEEDNKYSLIIPNNASYVHRVAAELTTVDGKIISCPADIQTDKECPMCRCEMSLKEEGDKYTVTVNNLNYAPNSKYYISLNKPLDVNNPRASYYERQSLTFDKADGVVGVYAYVVERGVIHFGPKCRLELPQTNSCQSACQAKDYNCIRNYCSENPTDGGRYKDQYQCLAACSSTCSNIPCNDKTALENYCNSKYKEAGYKNVSACLNDCVCYGRKYFYRPIDFQRPFPDREPGPNWYGMLDVINKAIPEPGVARDEGAEFIVKLDASSIREIRKQTKAYNMRANQNAYFDHVRPEFYKGLEFKSRFIHVDNMPGGGFKNIFTVIDGEKLK